MNNDVAEETWEIEQTDSEEIENEDTLSFEISHYPADITLQGYVDKDKDEQLILPEFQRRYVWSQIQASKLIESFLLGLPVPNVFLYKQRGSNKLMIIDGQQRIRSAINYLTGTFGEKVFRLRGVNKKWEGRKFTELDEVDQLQLKDSVLRATIVQQLDPQDDSSIYHVFERLNTGGVKLNPMEVRRCVFFGPLVNVLEKLNENEKWREIIGKKAIDVGFKDVELILRILALHDAWRRYEKPMKEFLNRYMTKNRQIDEDGLHAITDNFTKGIEKIHAALGAKPFHLKGRLNYAVMDSVFVAVLESGNVQNLKENYDCLITIPEYIEACSVSTSDEKVVNKRFTLASQYLNQ